MTEAKVTIGHVARAAGVNIETVRYYHRRGLVPLPPKRARGFRYYTPATASKVRFIKRAQALGMSLKEVQRLMKLDASIEVWPGHDYGVAPSSTIGHEIATNPFLLAKTSRNSFI